MKSIKQLFCNHVFQRISRQLLYVSRWPGIDWNYRLHYASTEKCLICGLERIIERSIDAFGEDDKARHLKWMEEETKCP